MTSVLVTGAQGFLGRNLCATLLEANPDDSVIGIGRSPELPGMFTHAVAATLPNLAPLPRPVASLLARGFKYERLSVEDTPQLTKLIQRYRPQVIYHLAGPLRPAITGTITRGIERVASVMRAVAAVPNTVRLVVISSSGAVYGAPDPEHLPMHESHPCAPVDAYGHGKVAEEAVATRLAREIPVELIVARIFNLCGPGQDEGHACGRFAGLIAANPATLQVRPLHATRDLIDVRDAARALVLLASRGQAGMTYNVANGREVQMSSVLQQMLALAGFAGQVEASVPEQGLPNVSRHFADVERLRGLGFSPLYELPTSLKDMIAYHAELAGLRGADEMGFA